MRPIAKYEELVRLGKKYMSMIDELQDFILYLKENGDDEAFQKRIDIEEHNFHDLLCEINGIGEVAEKLFGVKKGDFQLHCKGGYTPPPENNTAQNGNAETTINKSTLKSVEQLLEKGDFVIEKRNKMIFTVRKGNIEKEYNFADRVAVIEQIMTDFVISKEKAERIFNKAKSQNALTNKLNRAKQEQTAQGTAGQEQTRQGEKL